MSKKITQLDQNETTDIWELYHGIPFMTVSRNAFISMVLHCAPKITLKTLGLMSSEELQVLLDLYWNKWNIDRYDWLQCFGIAPWYWRYIKGTAHKVPVVPPFGSGYISTYMDETHVQRFTWCWREFGGEDKGFEFETKGRQPLLTGKYQSPVSTLLTDWRTAKIIREAKEIAAYQQARVQHVFEHHPPKNVIGDDNLTTLESFGDTIASTVLARQEGLANAKMTIRSDQLHGAIAEATARNAGLKTKFGNGATFLNGDKKSNAWEIENSNVIERGIPLKPDFTYKPVPSPNVHENLGDILKRLDHMASAIMDVPMGVIEATGGKTMASVAGNFRFLNERIKDWQKFFEQTTKRAFILAYGEILDKEFKLRTIRESKMIQLYVDLEVVVEMPCTPIAHANDIEGLYRGGWMSKEDAGKHMFNVMGMPLSDLTISDREDTKRLKSEGQINDV